MHEMIDLIKNIFLVVTHINSNLCRIWKKLELYDSKRTIFFPGIFKEEDALIRKDFTF